MGGEPTFVSVDDYQAAEWNTAALGPMKRERADELIRRLRKRFAPGGLLHYGQGKWYPGEPMPRWAFALLLAARRRADLARRRLDRARSAETQSLDRRARQFAEGIAARAGIDGRVRAARLMRTRSTGWSSKVCSRTISIRAIRRSTTRTSARACCKLFDSHLGGTEGLRAAAATLDGAGKTGMAERNMAHAPRPAVSGAGRFAARLPAAAAIAARCRARPTIRIWCRPIRSPNAGRCPIRASRHPIRRAAVDAASARSGSPPLAPDTIGRCSATAAAAARRRQRRCARRCAVEVRDGRCASSCRRSKRSTTISNLIATIEATAAELGLPVHVEGYAPPPDPRLNVLKVTPDPGVIEVNIQPADILARSRRHHARRLRRRASLAARHRQIHARRPAHRHRRRQSRRARRPGRRRQPVPAAARSAQEPGRYTRCGGRRCPICFPACSSARPARRRASTRRARTCSTNLKSRSARCRAGRPRTGAAVAGRPAVPQHSRRRDRQHAPHRNLHRQTVFAGRPDRPARPGRISLLRNAAGSAHEPGAAIAVARADRLVLACAARGQAGTLGHGAARPLHAASISSGATSSKSWTT